MVCFCGHFAAAYGSFWRAMMRTAVLFQSRVYAGACGLFGFPALAALYALLRTARQTGEVERLRARVASLEARVASSEP